MLIALIAYGGGESPGAIFTAARDLASKGAPIVIVHPAAPVGPWDRTPTVTGRRILDVLAGKMPFRARELCWPIGAPGFPVFSAVEPTFFFQKKDEIVGTRERVTYWCPNCQPKSG